MTELIPEPSLAPCLDSNLFVQVALSTDSSGRVRQALECCPGAVIFAAGLHECGAVLAAELLLLDIVSGRKLNTALDEAIARYAQDILRVESISRGDVMALRQLIVRAGAGLTDCKQLMHFPPPAFTLEDIPSRGSATNAGWFRIVSHAAVEMARSPGTESRERGFGLFISKQAVEFSTFWELSRHERELVAVFWESTTRWPLHRNSALPEAGTERYRWTFHRMFSAIYPPESKLPRFGDPWAEGAVEIAPLTTVQEVLDLGEELQNCLPQLIELAIAGCCVLFRVKVGDELLALQLLNQTCLWEFGQFLGRNNRLATPTEWAAIAPFLDALNVADDESDWMGVEELHADKEWELAESTFGFNDR